MKATRLDRAKRRCRSASRSGLLAVILLPMGAYAETPFIFLTNWYAQAEHGGFYEAQAEGLYKSAGLEVTIRMGGPQVNAVQLLAANRAQCAISDDVGTMSARMQGVPIRLVATTFQHDPTVLIAHDDVAKIADLKNKILLVSIGAHASWLPWAKATLGFTEAQVRPYTYNIQPFIAGGGIAQQGYLTADPYAMQQAGVHFKTFLLSDYGYPAYGNAIACRTDVIEQHSAVVASFLRASMQGWKNYLSNPTAGDALIRVNNPNMTDGQLDYSVKTMKSSGLVTGGDAKTLGIGVITSVRMTASWKMAVGSGLIDPAVVPLDQIYTTALIDRSPVLP